jgi:hypothetical protein
MNSEVFESPVAKSLASGNLTSSQITAQIFRAGNEKFIKKLSETLPEETWNSLKAQNLANLLENFSEQSDKIPGSRVLTKGDQLVKWIENNKNVLYSTYDVETIKAFENFAKLAKASKNEISEFNKGAFELGSLSLTGALGGMRYSEPTSLVISTPLMMGIANEMMRPNGVLKQWLTTGLKGAKTAGEAAKLGGRAVVAGEDDGSN